MNVLITGIDGFIASHLAEHILHSDKKAAVYGTIRRMASHRNIQHIEKDMTLLDMELMDPYSVRRAVELSHPDVIFHLAAQSFVPYSWTAPASTMEVNVVGTINLLEAVRAYTPSSYVQLASSSEAYGMVKPEECPITEDQPLRPLSPYGVSKAAVDHLGYQYHKSYGMNIVRTRTFNQTGPRRGVTFVDSNFAKQIVECELGQRKCVEHGNLEAVRDFSDVRDTVRAYVLLSRVGTPGEAYNICSGKGVSMETVLDTLMGLSRVKAFRTMDYKRQRPSDVPLLIGSKKKLDASMGLDWYNPKYQFKESMLALLDYWRGELGASPSL